MVKRNLVNITLIGTILFYLLYNVVYVTDGINKNIWNCLYYITIALAFIVLSLFNVQQRRFDKRIRIVFAGLQGVFLFNRLFLLFSYSYNHWYYNIYDFEGGNSQLIVGIVEGVICLIVLLYIWNG